VLAAPVMFFKKMFTTFDVYSFGAFLHDYWCCKQGKIKKGEVRRTDSRTLPTVFD
jgi:hypothetical protein